MNRYFKIIPLILVLALFTNCSYTIAKKDKEEPARVELVKNGDSYQLHVNNAPFYIRGAGLEGGSIEMLAKHGGNAMRTWRTDNSFRTGQEILDEAYKHGIMVCMGIEIARERHGFDYDDTLAVRKQFEYARGEVLKYKDHPALLAWGIGNELNLHYSNPKVWDAVNEIAEMIQATDPNHPVTTMLAGANKEVVAVVLERCPSLDFLSFQLYADIVNLPRYIDESEYTGAYIVSEWGATGHWEVAKTQWGRPIEQNSHEKAMAYKSRYENVIASDQDQCIGSFVFLWGQKQERTPTWYGIFLEGGQNTESADVMQYLWTGEWPENRSPILRQFLLNEKSAYENIILSPGQQCQATALIEDHENDPLIYHWEILPEVPVKMQSDGGDFEQRPQTILKMESEEGEINFDVPVEEGQYRLFVYAFDGHNNAATANIPFLIKK
ncbi:MAG: glycoside hydrolase family 2 TIM barrel-domain containing protein [Bacteroidales bacterium]|nr:glycoside hydrolase family 2 TIM barrel-domain containing protein [Bacteroidales bacterium]